MVVEEISIEEYITALETRSVADRLRVIAAISSGLVEENTPKDAFVDEEVSTIDSQNEPVFNSEEGFTRLTLTENDRDSKKTGLTLQELFGAWKEIDKGWERPIEDMIRESQVSKSEAPNFNL